MCSSMRKLKHVCFLHNIRLEFNNLILKKSLLTPTLYNSIRYPTNTVPKWKLRKQNVELAHRTYSANNI